MANKLCPRRLCSFRLTRRARSFIILISVLLISCLVIFYSTAFLNFHTLFATTGSVRRKTFDVSEVPWLEYNAFVYIDNGTQGTIGNATFLLVLPYSSYNEMNEFSAEDQRALIILEKFLSSMKEFGGATCLQRSPKFDREEENSTVKTFSLESSWCSFMKRNWSINIRTAGYVRNVNLPKTLANGPNISFSRSSGKKLIEYQVCNIAQGPFIIRRDVFDKIGGVHDGLGKVTLIDFFLRSEGRLKIAKLANCSWSSEITRMDRGNLEGSKIFTEYTSLGNKHEILRIVLPRQIEWTACLVNWKYCREEPYVKPQDLPAIALPICCNAVLHAMLTDMVWALEKLNLDYSVVFGTLLGGVRNKSIIPWTYDIDLALSKSVFRNPSTYTALQQVLGDKYYVGQSAGMKRAHMHGPPYIKVDTARFFDGPIDLNGNALFGVEFDEAVKGMLPISTIWRDTTYVDFYEGQPDWMNSGSFVTINGRNYPTVKDVNGFLKYWYGDKFLVPKLKGKWVAFP